MSFRGKLTERFADVPKMRPDLVKIGIIKDEFVYGSLVVDGKRCFICISAFVGNQSYVSNACATMFEVDPETVGQFTGLTDKSGAKIFEGDILRDDDAEENGVVVFEEGEFCVVFGNVITHGISDIAYSCYIRGNIHDNPELLGESMKPASKNVAQSGLAPATENFELLEA